VKNDAAIQVVNLTKHYGKLTAVDHISFEAKEGELFGFLGPNGAGKTTAIKMLLGLVAPTSGDASLLGAPLGDRATRARIGFLPEHFRFHDWLTAAEFLTLHGQLYGMPAGRLRQRAPALLELVGLSAFGHKLLRTFSKGMLQRIGLAQALLNDPGLVFLDEPTSGLDPVGRRLVRDIIHDLRSRGTTVFLNSHLLSEVEITCDRVAFIKHGEVLRVSELKALVDGATSVTIRTGGLAAETMVGLGRWGQDIRADGSQVTLTVTDASALPAIARYLVAQNVEVYALTPQRLSLEDLFIQIVGTDGGL